MVKGKSDALSDQLNGKPFCQNLIMFMSDDVVGENISLEATFRPIVYKCARCGKHDK